MSPSIPELPLERFFTGRQKVISKLINGLIFKNKVLLTEPKTSFNALVSLTTSMESNPYAVKGSWDKRRCAGTLSASPITFFISSTLFSLKLKCNVSSERPSASYGRRSGFSSDACGRASLTVPSLSAAIICWPKSCAASAGNRGWTNPSSESASDQPAGSTPDSPESVNHDPHTATSLQEGRTSHG